MFDVLFTWELGGGLGHVGRLRPLAEAFLRRGKSVAFAVRDVRFCSTVFQGTPIRWFQAPAKIGRPQNEITEPRTFAEILHNVGFGDLEELTSLAMGWRNLLGILQPKLVILEHSPIAALSVRGTTAKTAAVGTGFNCPADTDPLQDLRPWVGGSPAPDAETSVLARINTVLGGLGQPPLPRISRLYADADATELITFPELDPYGARPGVRYWGTWNSSWGIRPQWPPGTPRVFFYLKPCPALEPLLKAIAPVGLAAIIYVPELAPDRIRAIIGGAALVLSEPADLCHILQSCDLAVLHGTHGVLTEALLAGKPTLNLPLNLEQLLHAQRVEKLRAGLTGNPGDAAQAPRLLKAVLERGVLRQGAQAFAQRYQALDPAAQADKLADRLMSLLH